MQTPVRQARVPARHAASAAPQPAVRAKVKDLLLRSPAFRKLPREQRDDLAHNMARVADYLSAPEGVPGHQLAGGLRPRTAGALAEPPANASYEDAAAKVSEIGNAPYDAAAAMAGARAAGEYMRQVNFTDFVEGLINGVFHSIVGSSMEQMEAYGKLVNNVAMSLNRFRDENVSANQGRDHAVEQFPDLFELGRDEFSDDPSPRLQLRQGVDEDAALTRVRQGFGGEGATIDSLDMSDPEMELKVVMAARNQLATSRQQLLATLVMMGINRIVINEGRISAKINYDFQARDNRRLSRSAAAYDYARDASGNLQTTWEGEGEYDSGGDESSSRRSSKDDSSSERDADWYAKGTYKYAQKPVMNAMSIATDAQDSQLSVKAQLAGSVDVSFKSDYLPLEKMATPGMIAAIQMNSRPVDPNVLPSARTPPAAPNGAAPGSAAPATTTPAP